MTWTYDRYGNRLSQTQQYGAPPSNDVILEGGVNNRVSQARYNGGAYTPWSHDAAGNVINDGRNSYQYDAENRIISTTVIGSGATTTYEYGASGERVLKATASLTTYYYWGIAERESGQWTKLHVNALGGKLAEYSNGTTYFYANNHLGNVAVQMDLNGYRTQSPDYAFYPFGERMSGSGSPRHQFTGKERDAESGNDYFGARYYWNGAGRWLSADPVLGDKRNPQRLNRYSYTLNDPINYVDPDGADPSPFIEICNDDSEGGLRCHTDVNPFYSPFQSRNRQDRGSWLRALLGLLTFDQRVNRALDKLESKLAPDKISDTCKNFFNTIGVAPEDFLSTLQSVQANIFDGTKSTDLIQNVVNPQYANATGTFGWTVADLFRNNFPGSNPNEILTGWSPPGPNIYLRGTGYANPETIAHETLHKFPGLDDPTLKNRLGIPLTAPSSEISTKFKEACLQ